MTIAIRRQAAIRTPELVVNAEISDRRHRAGGLVAGGAGRFDIVSFDPRGVARSQPVICYRGDGVGLDPDGGLPLLPVSDGEELRTIIANSGRCPRRGRCAPRHRKPFADVGPEQRPTIRALERVIGR